jgi:uncharacterized membrane protein (UPF0182 family)
MFDEEERPQQPPRRKPTSRPRALLPTLGIVVALVVIFSVFVEIWTGRLWFASVGYSGVFTTVLWTRTLLFFAFGLLLAGAAVGNIYLAFRTRPILFSDGYRNPTVERYQDTVDPIRHWVLIGLGVVMFLFGGASASGQWKTFLLWRNRVPFNQDDVYFHKDIGFFIFNYPWFRFLTSFAFTTLVIALIVTAATHYLYGGIRLGAKRDRFSHSAQVQLSVLLGLFMLVKAVSYWLDRYGLATSDGSLFTGISYADEHAVLPAKSILMIIALICALLFFGNVFRPGWMLPVLGFGLLILSAILIGGIWPAIVQRFQVKPSEADKEATYISMNIDATRSAYDIAKVETQDYPGVSTDSPEELQKLADALPGVRLIDPKLVAPAFEQLQQRRGFYKMPDVLDVDRYEFENGKPPQDVVVAARELSLSGLRDDQRNWTNDHTVYTHGYGVVAAYGDERGPVGEPVWAQEGLPSQGELGDFEQRVYYGESEPDYSIVGAPKGTTPVELNIPATSDTGTDSDQNSTYDGDGGVPIGSTFNQLLYAAKFWDSSILLSGRVNSESKVIYDRDPRTMVEKVAPWLTFDSDAYPAVVDGRLQWILDGYTTTADYPMSEHVDLSETTSDSLTPEDAVAAQKADDINYIRNSVKATVDAYDGTVKLYEWDNRPGGEPDPLLHAWMGAFPDVVQPYDDISDDLLAHFRYPEDLFKVQRELLATYHVTDPKTFYGGSENWRVPEDPTGDSTDAKQPPYFLTVKMPDDVAKETGGTAEPEFSLTSVYEPNGRQNLASFMAVNADARSENYGRFTVLSLVNNDAVSGPSQVANAMSNDPTVRARLLSYTQAGTTVLNGNLLTLPVGDELLYAQPIYTLRGGTGTGTYPILQFVVISISDQVGIGRSFDEAFANALDLTVNQGGGTENPGGGNNGGGGNSGGGNETLEQKETRLLQKASQKYEAAQRAYNNNDLGRYQDLNAQAADLIAEVLALRDGSTSSEGSTDGSSTPSDSTPTDSTPTDSTPTTPGS